MTIKAGERLPDGTLTVLGDAGPERKSVAELFAGRDVLLFAVPGAFTPTCHRSHLPGFVDQADAFRAKGLDVACLATNDIFVLGAWAEATGATGRVEMLADGNAEFVRALGLELDASGLGIGIRAQRFAMRVQDGRVVDLTVEPNAGEVGVASAAAMLARL